MFERFTDRARRVVVLAQEEARELGHNYIGTEHILLGLVREGEGVAARALEALDIRLEAVRQEILAIIGRGEGMPAGHIPFTPRAKKVLELSLREAQQLGHHYIGTEHILLGLVREGEGVAAQVLVKLGGDLNRVRQQVIRVLHASGAEEAGSAPEPGEKPPGEAGPRTVTAEARAGQLRVFGSPGQLESLGARLGEVISRLDVIAARLESMEERLASIEGQSAQGRRPPARAPRKPNPPLGEPSAGGEAQPG